MSERHEFVGPNGVLACRFVTQVGCFGSSFCLKPASDPIHAPRCPCAGDYCTDPSCDWGDAPREGAGVDEVQSAIDAAGEALGTHPDLRNIGCVTALAEHVAWLRAEVERLKADVSDWRTVAGEQREIAASASQRISELERALRTLRIDANRLCDRNQGGTYEADCRRSIAAADVALHPSTLSEEK